MYISAFELLNSMVSVECQVSILNHVILNFPIFVSNTSVISYLLHLK